MGRRYPVKKKSGRRPRIATEVHKTTPPEAIPKAEATVTTFAVHANLEAHFDDQINDFTWGCPMPMLSAAPCTIPPQVLQGEHETILNQDLDTNDQH